MSSVIICFVEIYVAVDSTGNIKPFLSLKQVLQEDNFEQNVTIRPKKLKVCSHPRHLAIMML